mmetsp:Transcript_45815/g.107062  ORF Transcript_45815/g.107062 Transcript_45815/m.107062 type:complete len:82 (-) Transcript_45815:9-254(-)
MPVERLNPAQPGQLPTTSGQISATMTGLSMIKEQHFNANLGHARLLRHPSSGLGDMATPNVQGETGQLKGGYSSFESLPEP